MERIIGMLIFMGIYFALEFYVFNGLKAVFKTGMPNSFKWAYWGVVVVPIVWMIVSRAILQDKIGDLRWLNNLVIGISVTLIITKLFFAIFLAVEDIYRIFRFGGESLKAAMSDSKDSPHFESRRRFIGQIGLAVSALPFFSFLYGVTRGKYAYTVHQTAITFPDLPAAFDGLRIVQISDIHAGSFDSIDAVARGVKLIQAQKPDIILFTGDLVNNYAQEIEPYIHLFKTLEAPFGKFSVLGNHDYGSYIRWESEAAERENMRILQQHHASMGFKLMNNESLKLEKDGESIRLAGVENWGDGPYPKEGDLDKAFAGVAANEFTVLMSHDPSHWKKKILDFPKQVHLTLSGHTHGMQMGVEVAGVKWSPSQWRYPQWAGLYTEAEQHIYVNRGFGFLGFPGRVGILPEITVLELKRG